jgi:hypothetical protein
MPIKAQIEGLKVLLAVYHRHGILGPNNRQITFRDGDDVEMRRCFKAFLDGTEHGWEKQDKAQRLLLASGFLVPDHWLNLNVGEVGDSWNRDRGTTVSIHSVDEKGLDLAAKEISLAILRLEAAPRDGNSPPADALPDAVTPTANGSHGNGKPMRILFMAANPFTTDRLDLEEELRSLELELRGVKHRDQITLSARHAARPDDLLRYVREEQPTIIHFSGHGSAKGIVLRTDDGGCTEVSGQSLRRFLDGRGVDLLVLNACYSRAQADHVASAVTAVVGTTSAVGDDAARRFTVAFYRTLGNGLSIREAFRDGGDAVALHWLEDVFWSSGDLNRILLGSCAR